jgi:hypothetical protein
MGAPVGVLGAVLATTAGAADASWAGTPPSTIAVPQAGATTVPLAAGSASGLGRIVRDEVDWFTFLAPTTGDYAISALTPASTLDTVLGAYNGSGQRIAFNDDITPGSDRDSRVAVHLTSGARVWFGITNYTGSPDGPYQWAVDRPK